MACSCWLAQADERLVAVLTGGALPLDGDSQVQAFLAEDAAASGVVGDLVLAVDRPDVLVDVAGVALSTPAGEVAIQCEFGPCSLRRQGQLVGPECLAKSLQRLLASVSLAYGKRVAPLSGPTVV